MTMHTKDKLAEALREAELPFMADKAAAGYYHDFLSPLDLPTTALVADLAAAATPAAMELRLRVMNGEFDASEEESNDWAASPEGQAALKQLSGM